VDAEVVPCPPERYATAGHMQQLKRKDTTYEKNKAPLFQAWDMPTAQPVSERRLAARGPQGLLRCWVHTPLEAMAGQHQQQRSPHDGGPGIRRA
jgi:hypothetical protein